MSPVLVMSTVPERDSPGLSFVTFRIAAASLEFVWLRLPAVTTLPGLADVELKFAPEPTAIIAASRRANRTPTIFWGEACQTAANRCMGGPFTEGCRRGGWPRERGRRWYRPFVQRLEGPWTDVRTLRTSLRRRARSADACARGES